MSYLDIESGTYTARPLPISAGKSSKKGTPFIRVRFFIPSIKESCDWTGYLTENTQDRTLDVMDTLGWNGDEDFNEGSWDVDKIVSIEVEREMGQDGKERPKVQFVNDPDKPRFNGTQNDKSALAGLNLKAEMASRRAKNKKPASAAPSFDSDEKLPF